ncbi:hypothetical protein OCK74_09540 [Chitinophagaceae bacterium LB-8]|uniref:Uncharacterized protein n=1 Tax=Paraflavisolibacter caeni TaxID=2982496 RepID=A0A9X2XUL8_9BACT|nr:hypothetical protein [Paraflavisolibacter caeni]MCU7549356.1 hypothetical protein [Paraflavisolibacter caeni]
MGVIETVWLNEKAKWNNCIERLKQNSNTVIITWFEDTLHQLENLITQANLPTSTLFPSRQVTHDHIKNVPVIFAEHYPLHHKEKELYKKLHLTQAEVYSSLDEPLFKHFGSNRLVEITNRINCQENEPVHHRLVNAAIKKAQEEIASMVALEQGATSQAGWLMRNLTA